MNFLFVALAFGTLTSIRGQCNLPLGCGAPAPAPPPYGGPPPAPPSYGGQPQPPNPYGGYPSVNYNKIIICPSDSEAKKDGKGNYLACLPNKPSCPDDAACWYNGLNYYCCKMEKDPPYVTGPPVPPAPYGVPPSSGYGQQQPPSSGYGAPAAVPSSYGFIGQQAIPFGPPTNACGGGSGCAPSCGAGGCSLSQSAPCTLAGGCAQPPASPCGNSGCGIPSFPCRGILTAKGCWPSEESRGGSYGQIPSPSYGQVQQPTGYGQVQQPIGVGQIPQPTGYGQSAKTNGGGKIKGHIVPRILWYVNTEPKCCRVYPDNQNACPFNCPPPQQFRPQPSFPSNGFSPYGSNVGGGNVEPPTPGFTPAPLTEPPPPPPLETTAVTEAVTTVGTTVEETTAAEESTTSVATSAASDTAASTAAATTVASTGSQDTTVGNTETLPPDQTTTAAAANTPPSPPTLLARDEILLDNISNDLENDSKKKSIGMNSHLANYFDSVIFDQQKSYLQSQRTANDAYARWLDNFYRSYQK